MNTNEILKLMGDKDFLEKIYGFSYRRCNTSTEAEELCSDIIYALLSALHRYEKIDNFYGFVWTVARRVYADYSRERSVKRQNINMDDVVFWLASDEDEIENLIERETERELLKKIIKEMAFLSKIYREVMVMYYLDGKKVKEIAEKLSISENTVKQRLFSARNTVRKEVSNMNDRVFNVKPVYFYSIGTGSPCGNDPALKAERAFSRNLIYLCKERPKTAAELSEELCVPMTYVEEELEIQCRGENGNYGMLQKLDDGKYALNVFVVDHSEFDQANTIFDKHLPEVMERFAENIEKCREDILKFPYLSKQNDLSFILWTMLSRWYWKFSADIKNAVSEKYFSDVKPKKRPYSLVSVAFKDGGWSDLDAMGCDGIHADMVCGYKSVFISNVYCKALKAHFHCGHVLSHDPKLLLLLRSIDGLSLDSLSEEQREVAAKAVECGYLRKNGKMLEPNVVVIDEKDAEDFYAFSHVFDENMEEIKKAIADELGEFMKKHIPSYLLCDHRIYSQLIAGVRMQTLLTEECIKRGLLTTPKDTLCGEGVLVVTDK